MNKICTKKTRYSSREMAERFAQMKTYSEDKNGRLGLYSIYGCDTCNAWHIYKVRTMSKRMAKSTTRKE